MQILFVKKNIPDRDWLSRFAEGNPVKTDSFLLVDVERLMFDVHQLSFSFPFPSIKKFSTNKFLCEKFVICSFLVTRSEQMTDRTIDISKDSDFIYPNVIGESTEFFSTFSDTRFFNLKTRYAGRGRVILSGIGIISFCDD